MQKNFAITYKDLYTKHILVKKWQNKNKSQPCYA